MIWLFQKPPGGFLPPSPRLPLFPFLLDGRFLVGSPVFQFLQNAILDQLTLKGFDRILNLIALNFDFQRLLLSPNPGTF